MDDANTIKSSELIRAIISGAVDQVSVTETITPTLRNATVLLSHVYKMLGEKATFGEVEILLLEAIWWNQVFGAMETKPETIKVVTEKLDERPD